MTIEHDITGPGLETYRSSRFTATVNGTAQYVYGYTRAAGFTTMAWEYLDSIEMSWVKFGGDETATVVIALADLTPITSAVVYPKNVATNQSIVGGELSLTVPTNERIYVEVNGERDQPLMIFAEPLKSTIPTNDTFYTDLGKVIQSVNTTTDEITFGSAHGLSNGQVVIINLSPDGLAFPGGLVEGTRYTVSVVDATTITLFDELGDAVDITETVNDGDLYLNVATHTDTVNALHFEAGRYAIGRNFTLGSGTTVYLGRGAVVIGSFNLKDVTGITIRGPGQISGEFATYEAVSALSYQERLQYTIFNGTQDADNYSDNAVKEVTVFATPFWASNNGVWSYRNVQLVTPWTSNSDGFLPTRRNSATYASEVVDCFSFVGDDNVHIENRGPIVRTVSGSFFVNSAGACFHAGYEPEGTSSQDYGNTITDCDAMHLLQSSADSGAIVRCWMDGWPAASSNGVWNASFTNIRVWGPLQRQVFDLRNYSPAWDSDIRQQFGQIAEWTMSSFTVENAPSLLSIIDGMDVTNTPHDLTFTDLTIGGTLVTQDNYTEFFDINVFPYSLVWDEAPTTPVDPVDPDLIVEDGTIVTDANSYCTLTYADNFHLVRNGNPATWSGATEAVRKDALRQATFALDAIYGRLWAGYRYSSEQALDWPRSDAIDAAGNAIGTDTVPSALKNACALLAYEVVAGNVVLPKTETSADVSSETKTVGAVSKSVTYLGAKPSQTLYPAVRKVLLSSGLITSSGLGWGLASL